MKVIYCMAILTSFVACQPSNDVREYCRKGCIDHCFPCVKPVPCTVDQTDCGQGQPDPAFGGVCPGPQICVPKNENCKPLLICRPILVF